MSNSTWKHLPCLTLTSTKHPCQHPSGHHLTSRFIGPWPFAIKIVSGVIRTLSKPHSLAFLFLTFVGMTFSHKSRMLSEHNARTPGLLYRYSGFSQKWRHALRQRVCSTSLWVRRLLVNKPDILLRRESTGNICLSLCYLDQSVTENSINQSKNTLSRIFICINDSKMKPKWFLAKQHEWRGWLLPKQVLETSCLLFWERKILLYASYHTSTTHRQPQHSYFHFEIFFIHSLDVAVHTGANLYQLQDHLLWQSSCLL
jgi:hypothetical protein